MDADGDGDLDIVELSVEAPMATGGGDTGPGVFKRLWANVDGRGNFAERIFFADIKALQDAGTVPEDVLGFSLADYVSYLGPVLADEEVSMRSHFALAVDLDADGRDDLIVCNLYQERVFGERRRMMQCSLMNNSRSSRRRPRSLSHRHRGQPSLNDPTTRYTQSGAT